MEDIKKYKYWKWSMNDISNNIPIKSMRNTESDDKNDDKTDNNDDKINKLQNFVPFETIIVEPSNKRSENSERISAREMIIQTNINPFLNNNYLDDIKVQDTILRPKDSNYNDESVNYNH